MNKILVSDGAGRKIIFEPEKDLPENFISAKKYLNSRFLETGTFPEYAFNKVGVREPTQDEQDYYNALKDHSTYLIGKDVLPN